MNDVKWIKLDTNIFSEDTIQLIEQMPDGDGIIVFWFKLLCLAGRCNSRGVLLMHGRAPYTDDMLAVIFRKPIAKVRNALNVLKQFGMIDVIGNSITIPTWEIHQNLDGLEKIRTDTARRVAGYRARQKQLAPDSTEQHEKAPSSGGCNVTVTLPVTQCNDAEEELEEESIPYWNAKEKPTKEERLRERFDAVWAKYPRKDGKQNAFKAYCAAIKDGATDEQITDGIQRYMDYFAALGREEQYLKMGSTFFNQRCWEDEYTVRAPQGRSAWDDIPRIY